MGTNFYVETASTQSTHCPACGHATGERRVRLHLGKSSSGWPFLFRASDDDNADNAYDRWLQRAQFGEIVDEYGTSYSLEELLRLIELRVRTAVTRQVFSGQFVDTAGRRWERLDFT